ncbi:MAG: plasmid mobilization relaxosome protein MobC [Bacteroidota bacterium]
MNAEKKHRGRPQLTTGKRIKKVDVRFTELEYKEVLKMESTLGINRSDLIRIRVLAGSKSIVINAVSLLGQLDAIGAEMGRAGNNINQLAKYSNILKNEGILSPVVVERFLILLESYLKDHRQMEAAVRKILRTMNQPAI